MRGLSRRGDGALRECEQNEHRHRSVGQGNGGVLPSYRVDVPAACVAPDPLRPYSQINLKY